MNCKLAIFDLDGTILDTIDDLADSVNYALGKFNLPTRTIDEIRTFVGNGIHRLIERSVPQNTDNEIIEAVYLSFKAYYKRHCADKTKPYDGIVDTILTLRKCGIKTAVVSNKADFAVQQLCNQYFGEDMFDVVFGEREGIKRKPSPDCVNEVVSMLGMDKDEVVYIGDSEVDIKTAENAKIKCISVTWGFRNRRDLENSGGNIFVNIPLEIIDILTSKKILIIGGSFQGKLDFAKKLTGFDDNQVMDIHNFDEQNCENCRILNGLHQLIRDNRAFDWLSFADKFDVIICDEVGCGVVPIEKCDRQYRDEVGRWLCKIAENADVVYRLTCGIPQKIKG